MTRLILVTLFILTCGFETLGQKERIPGVWRGKVESVNASTREITLTPMSGTATEPFIGLLEERAKAKLLDDNVTEVSISEIAVGMHVRVFYETKNERVGGRQGKVNHIRGLIFLGRDSFDKLRVLLNLASSTVFTLNLTGDLPASNPLKLYIFVQPPRSKDDFVKWVGRWNKDAANTYGAVELVTDLQQADLSLLVCNREVEIIGTTMDADMMLVPSASVFLVKPKNSGLEVLWKYEPLVSSIQSSSLMERVAKEMEKRIKARGKP